MPFDISIDTNMLIGLFIVSCFIYTLTIFKLLASMLNAPRFSKIVLYAFAFFNSAVLSIFTLTNPIGTYATYLIFIFLLVVEFFIYFDNKFCGLMTCSLAVTAHIFCSKSIITALFAILHNKTIFEVLTFPEMVWSSQIIALFICFFATICVLKFIPTRYLRILNQTPEQSVFLLIICALINAYMLINTYVYIVPLDFMQLPYQQIVTSLFMMCVMYTVLFMLLRFYYLNGFKEKNEELQKEVDRSEHIKQALFVRSSVYIELNCTKNLITRFMHNGSDASPASYDYNEHVRITSTNNIHPDDYLNVMLNCSIDHLVMQFENGITETQHDYRTLMKDGNYKWYRSYIKTELRGEDIFAFNIITDINEEKERELSLKYNAERDLLSGAYNKITTEMLITSHLLSDGTGSLLLIDIDNFKLVNDNLGHLFGDGVLKEIYGDIKSIFREKDIIGRIGGDEFMIYLKNTVAKEVVAHKASLLCQSIAKSYALPNGSDVAISASVGIAIAPTDGLTFESLYMAADSAMYLAKTSGKSGYKFYEKE